MMKNYMTTRIFTKGKKPEGDSAGKVVALFPDEKAVVSIYGLPTPPPPMSPSVSSNLQVGRSTS
jgi:hypothetical protein